MLATVNLREAKRRNGTIGAELRRSTNMNAAKRKSAECEPKRGRVCDPMLHLHQRRDDEGESRGDEEAPQNIRFA